MNDRQKTAKVKCKRNEPVTKWSQLVEYILLSKKHLSFMLVKFDQEKREIEQIWMWNPMTTGYIK